MRRTRRKLYKTLGILFAVLIISGVILWSLQQFYGFTFFTAVPECKRETGVIDILPCTKFGQQQWSGTSFTCPSQYDKCEIYESQGTGGECVDIRFLITLNGGQTTQLQAGGSTYESHYGVYYYGMNCLMECPDGSIAYKGECPAPTTTTTTTQTTTTTIQPCPETCCPPNCPEGCPTWCPPTTTIPIPWIPTGEVSAWFWPVVAGVVAFILVMIVLAFWLIIKK